MRENNRRKKDILMNDKIMKLEIKESEDSVVLLEIFTIFETRVIM